jgi:hypothetical protein
MRNGGTPCGRDQVVVTAIGATKGMPVIDLCCVMAGLHFLARVARYVVAMTSTQLCWN